jgi:sugar phosphate isomerase/epimerase
VPVDKKLEGLGPALCASAGYFDRIEGAKILRYFKNDRNADILKRLLKDPGFSIAESGRFTKDRFEFSSRKKVYEVRRIAYEALREFGANVDVPVIEVPLGDDKEAPIRPRTKKC